MTLPWLVILTCVSALSFCLALPNEFTFSGFPLGGFFCLVPYFYALKRVRSRRQGAALGFVFGVLFHASSSWWLANFKDYAVWTLGATSLLYGFFYGFWAIFLSYAANAGAYSDLSIAPHRENRSPAWPFLAALVWTIMEWQKSNGYLAFPWGLLPYTVQSAPVLIQVADTTGVYGLSFLLALCNAVLAELVLVIQENRTNPKNHARKESCTPWFARGGLRSLFPGLAAVVLLLGWTLGYGVRRLEHPAPVLRKIPLVLVQHNIDQYRNDGEALHRAVNLSLKGTVALMAQGSVPAMIVWSETLLTMPYRGNRLFPAHPAVPFLEQSGIPVLTGAPLLPAAESDSGPEDTNPQEIYNGVILVRRGRISASYAKRQLIPFAEIIPFASHEWMRNLMERFAGFSSGWTAGKEAVVMEIPGLRFGTPICFEDAFAGICRDFIRGGAELLINLTNDSWSQSVSAEVQHLAAARFRTVENRMTLVRSTNSGCTVVIDAEGRTRASLPLFTADYLALDVPLQSGGPTTYFLLGDWFPLLCAILFAAQIIRHMLIDRAGCK